MLEYLSLARWNGTLDYLASGSPPIYVRLLVLNALFLAIAGVRRAAGADPMSAGMMLLAQLAMLGANLVVLYPGETQYYLSAFINRF